MPAGFATDEDRNDQMVVDASTDEMVAVFAEAFFSGLKVDFSDSAIEDVEFI